MNVPNDETSGRISNEKLKEFEGKISTKDNTYKPSENVVEDLMMEEIATIKEDADVVEAAKLMLDKHVTHIPVVNDDCKLIGIVTSWDLSKSIATNSNHLKDIMTKSVKYCNADDQIEEIARQMRKFDISCLPVVDEDMRVMGLITTDQISNLIS